MIKSGELVVVVDNVETMASFYTEKLFFDLVDLEVGKEEDLDVIKFVRLRKGKCFVSFKRPTVEELVETSYLKRCAGRAIGLSIEISEKDFKKLLLKYEKNKLVILFDKQNNDSVFFIKDPAGIKLQFLKKFETLDGNTNKSFLVSRYKNLKVNYLLKNDKDFYNKYVNDLKNFCITRRVAKKFFNLQIKNFAE